MAYPTDLDDFTTVANGNTITAAMFNTPNLAVEALEAEVGIDGTAAESLRYKCDNFFVAATHVFFAQATPPTGWTTDSAHKDNVLACKSDSGTYSTIGADKGSFTYTGMTNGNTVAEAAHTHTGPSHNHQWYDYRTPSQADQSYNTGGSAVTFAGTAAAGYGMNVDNASVAKASEDYYTTLAGTGATSGGSSHVHGGSTITHDGTDRPKATVGVIATYTGA